MRGLTCLKQFYTVRGKARPTECGAGGNQAGAGSAVRQPLEGLAVLIHHALCNLQLLRKFRVILCFFLEFRPILAAEIIVEFRLGFHSDTFRSAFVKGFRPSAIRIQFSRLPPIIPRVAQAIVHHGIEAGVLLDEDLAELPVLAKQNRLQTDHLQQCQEHSDQRPLAARVAE